MKISFRPHHFLCTLGFQGLGYSPAFVANYTRIVDALREDEGLPITVVAETDSICSVCPHKRGILCKDQEKISALDQRHSQVLGLFPGMETSWREAKKVIQNKMTLEAFHKACAGCSWKPLGICEKALKALRSHDQEANA